MNITIDTLISNADRTGHGSHTVAHAAATLGITAHSLCCWCLESDRDLDEAQARRLPAGGECDRCAYVGRDCLVVAR